MNDSREMMNEVVEWKIRWYEMVDKIRVIADDVEEDILVKELSLIHI